MNTTPAETDTDTATPSAPASPSTPAPLEPGPQAASPTTPPTSPTPASPDSPDPAETPHSPVSPSSPASPTPTPVTPDSPPPAADPAEGSVESFDPTKVPPFPVITVEVITGELEHELLIDGRTQPVPEGESPTDAAVAAAARLIHDRGLRYSRVAGIIDGERYLFVVGADGSRHDLTAPGTAAAPRSGFQKRLNESKRLRAVVYMGGFGLMVVAVIIAVAVIFTTVTAPDAPEPEAAPIPPPAELPVLPPEGYSSHAVWAQPVHDETAPVVDLDNGHAAIITADRTLAVIEPNTGQVQWEATLTHSWKAGPWRTVIDGQSVIAVQTTSSLDWWPANGEATATPDGSLPLDNSSELVLTGETPMVVLPDQQALIVTGNGGLRRTIPAGADPIRADGQTITATNPAGQVWRLDTDAVHTPDPVYTLHTPKKIKDPTWTVVGTGGPYLLATVASSDATAATDKAVLYNLEDGTIADTAKAHARTGDWYASPTLAASGNLLIDLTAGDIHTLNDDTQWNVQAVIGDVAYGTSGTAPATLSSDGQLHAHPASSATPLHTSTDRAYVAYTDSQRQTWLYSLPRS